ncbi:DUF2919 domain-containing protein [Vibrio sp. S17_S38]|uniref:DUF2919 domain-containing protein n=1 Tax=Vibrio sp. S17_S38 TaxID=2720229 RepID=UPI0016806996|nr:DUF2919 domain-containing protein [Vibrio sp. S17_S38]MBD1571891.1 DUF2919 domain-containing protein [Vibrio sp. S17_S38]
MRYAIEDYDINGFLKPTLWLWLGWILLAKAWIVFIVASASRDLSVKLLTLIYPINNSLYVGLLVGLPVVVIAWCMGLRKPERKRLSTFLSKGWQLTALSVMVQFGLTLYHLSLTYWVFNWSDALTLLGLMWFLLFLLQSSRAKDTFLIPNIK